MLGLSSRIRRGLADYRPIQRDWPASADKRGWQHRDRLHPSDTEVARQPLLHSTAGWRMTPLLSWRHLRGCHYQRSLVANWKGDSGQSKSMGAGGQREAGQTLDTPWSYSKVCSWNCTHCGECGRLLIYKFKKTNKKTVLHLSLLKNQASELLWFYRRWHVHA